MSEQKNITSFKDDTFPTRLKSLMQKNKTTQPQLAEYIGITRQAVSLYATGRSKPDIMVLTKIADYFNVSADYLLGRTDVESLDTDLQSVCEYTGLSEEAVEYLHLLNNYKIGSTVIIPVEKEKQVISQVVSKMDLPISIIDILLCNRTIIGLIYSYFIMINDYKGSVYMGDRSSTILLEIGFKLKNMRENYMVVFEKIFNDYINKTKEAEKNG